MLGRQKEVGGSNQLAPRWNCEVGGVMRAVTNRGKRMNKNWKEKPRPSGASVQT